MSLPIELIWKDPYYLHGDHFAAAFPALLLPLCYGGAVIKAIVYIDRTLQLASVRLFK